MLSRIRRIYWSVVSDIPRTLANIQSRLHQIETLLRDVRLSPIERYLAVTAAERDDGLFHYTYRYWRATRVAKILELYGVDFFRGKSVLELGAGHGDIGAVFADLGANVLCIDGRVQNVNYGRLKYRNIPNFEIRHLDLEGDFSRLGRFDLILNFGLLYHLKNVESHLKCCFSLSDDVMLETVVCDSTDANKVLLVDENKDVNELAVAGVGSRPSPFYVERIATESGFRVERHFTPDLNAGEFVYDWKHRNDNNDGGWNLRRFWRMQRSAPTASLSPV
jgi:SAM-dependent methyltransferase